MKTTTKSRLCGRAALGMGACALLACLPAGGDSPLGSSVDKGMLGAVGQNWDPAKPAGPVDELSVAHVRLGDLYARMAGGAYREALELDRDNGMLRAKLERINALLPDGAKIKARPRAEFASK